MIRVLQQDLPIVSRPFDVWAADAGCTADRLIAAAQYYLDSGVMRRFSAVIRHRAAGFGANAMGAWIVPPNRQDQFGAVAASFAAVSHCYLRPTYEDWPYSIFTMVHGKTRSQCEEVLAAISAQAGVTTYTALYSTHEYKKVRVRYFTGDIEAWEAEACNRGAHCTS
jgi:DNA-binding Lrp family transcriptional regulator